MASNGQENNFQGLFDVSSFNEGRIPKTTTTTTTLCAATTTAASTPATEFDAAVRDEAVAVSAREEPTSPSIQDEGDLPQPVRRRTRKERRPTSRRSSSLENKTRDMSAFIPCLRIKETLFLFFKCRDLQMLSKWQFLDLFLAP